MKSVVSTETFLHYWKEEETGEGEKGGEGGGPTEFNLGGSWLEGEGEGGEGRQKKK